MVMMNGRVPDAELTFLLTKKSKSMSMLDIQRVVSAETKHDSMTIYKFGIARILTV
jgi:hypothetical protein